MRALVCKDFGTFEDLVIEEIDDPTLNPGQIVVDVRAAGVNFPDMLMMAGKYQVKVPPPFTPGFEAAGVVSTVGDDVAGFAVGDKVMFTGYSGAFAEKCVVDAGAAMPMPDGLDFEQGAGFPIAYCTSYHALKQSAQLTPEDTMLVLGAAGGVGITAVEIGKAMGARIIAAASSAEKLAFAKSAGADEVINYSELPMKDTVRELTGGKGVDVVYDPVGGDLAQQALRALGWHGRYLVIGFTSGEIPAFPANLALLKEASIVGVFWGQWSHTYPELQARNLAEMAEMIGAGSLQPCITEVFALEDFKDAYRRIAGRQALGKLVLRLG